MMKTIFPLLMIMVYNEISCYTIKQLNDPLLFTNEICSYNGKAVIETINNQKQITNCICDNEYDSIELKRTINGNKIFCSYEKKRQIIALFLAITLPIGLDYLYIGRIWVFIAILVYVLAVCAGNCYIFARTEREKNQEQDGNESEKKMSTTLPILAMVLSGIWLIFWIVDIILMACGIITDGNSMPLFDDLSTLMQYIGNK